MAESKKNQSNNGKAEKEEGEEDDYMGDLTQFLTTETSNPTKSPFKKVSAFLCYNNKNSHNNIKVFCFTPFFLYLCGSEASKYGVNFPLIFFFLFLEF